MELIDRFSDRWGNQTFRIFLSRAAARRNQFRQHRHADFEISLILSGTGTYHTESGDCDIRNGDIFLYSANEYHCITDVIPEEGRGCMELLNLQFSPAFLVGDNIEEGSPLDVFFHRTPAFRNCLDRDNPHAAELRCLLLAIRQECEEKPPCYRIAVRNRVEEFLITVMRHYGCTDRAVKSNHAFRYSENLQRAITYINGHFREPLMLDAIIGQAQMTKTHFLSVFRRAYGMTTWDYINIRRTDEACNLLAATDLTVLDIATRCGYSNTANFNRIFRKVTGITPREYRAGKARPEET